VRTRSSGVDNAAIEDHIHTAQYFPIVRNLFQIFPAATWDFDRACSVIANERILISM